MFIFNSISLSFNNSYDVSKNSIFGFAREEIPKKEKIPGSKETLSIDPLIPHEIENTHSKINIYPYNYVVSTYSIFGFTREEIPKKEKVLESEEILSNDTAIPETSKIRMIKEIASNCFNEVIFDVISMSPWYLSRMINFKVLTK